jgi:hypothetical protein
MTSTIVGTSFRAAGIRPVTITLMWRLSLRGEPPYLVLSFDPPNPSITSDAPMGSVLTTITTSWSDGSLFTGTLSCGPPYSSSQGVFAISGNNLIIDPNGSGGGFRHEDDAERNSRRDAVRVMGRWLGVLQDLHSNASCHRTNAPVQIEPITSQGWTSMGLCLDRLGGQEMRIGRVYRRTCEIQHGSGTLPLQSGSRCHGLLRHPAPRLRLVPWRMRVFTRIRRCSPWPNVQVTDSQCGVNPSNMMFFGRT